MRRPFPLLVLAAGLCLVASGCKPKPVKVSGRILRDGQPITFSAAEGTPTYPTLIFIAVEGQERHTAKIDMEKGTYEVELPPGKYQASLFIPPTDPSKPSGPPPTGIAQGDVYEFKNPTNTQDIPVPK